MLPALVSFDKKLGAKTVRLLIQFWSGYHSIEAALFVVIYAPGINRVLPLKNWEWVE